MNEDKKILKDKGLSLHSVEVNEVMGDIPHWITHWSMVLMAIIFLMLCIGSYILKLPEYLEVSYIVKGVDEPIAQFSSVNGILNKVIKENAYICDSQVIASIQTQNGENYVKANMSGCFYRNLFFQKGAHITEGDTIGWIVPKHKDLDTMILLKIPTINYKKVNVGDMVHLMNPDGKTYFLGHIQMISGVPIDNILLAVVVLENKEDIKELSVNIKDTGIAKIVVSNQRIIDKILLNK